MKWLLIVLVLIVAVVVGVGFYQGWFHVSTENADHHPGVTIGVDEHKIDQDKKKVEEQIQKDKEKLEDLGAKAKKEVSGATDKAKDGRVAPMKQRPSTEPQSREALSALIGEQLLHALGQPRDLLKVWVRPLWDNNYRVNVVTGKDAASASIANSYFLTVDADGQITASNPKILKQYESV